jgi:hypothetical protein
MMVSISLSNHFRRHAKEPGCFPNWNAALHEPGRRRVTERVWRNTRKAGECRRSGEPGLNRPNRLPVPFDEMASSAKPCPATHMSQQPRGNWNRRLALVRRTLADCEPVKHASIKIDVGAALCTHWRCRSNGRRARAGVEPDQNKSGDMAQRKFDRWNCALDLARAPARPKKPGGLAPREPAVARQSLRRQRNHHSAPVKPLLGMVPYGPRTNPQDHAVRRRESHALPHKPCTSPLKSPPASLPPQNSFRRPNRSSTLLRRACKSPQSSR